MEAVTMKKLCVKRYVFNERLKSAGDCDGSRQADCSMHVDQRQRRCDHPMSSVVSMTFIYKLNPVFHRDIPDVRKQNELPTSRLSEVIVWQTYIQTDTHDRNYIPRRFARGQKTKSSTNRWDRLL